MRPCWAAVLAGVAVLAGACASADGGDTPTDVVEIFGPYRNEEAALFAASLDEFSGLSGIEIRYTGTGAFVPDLKEQLVDAADPPDIALVPQPGLVAELYRAEQLAPLTDEVIVAIGENYDDPAVGLGTVDGELIGVPFRVSLKSLVWYRPSVLSDLGFSPPATLDELEQTVGRIEAGGLTPWCMGVEAQAATGWVATDWVEDLLLREAGVETYDGWIGGEVEFSDPSIASSFESFRSLVLQPGRLNGGISAALRTPVSAAHVPLLADPPGCAFHHQSNIAWGWMPEATTFGPDGDVDFFVLPGQTADGDPPLLVGADLAVSFDDRPAVEAVMAFLTTPASTQAWEAAGGFVSPRRTRGDVELKPPDAAVADLLADTESLHIDASDAMPPEVGTTPFWNQITQWMSGAVPYGELASTLDEAYASVP